MSWDWSDECDPGVCGIVCDQRMTPQCSEPRCTVADIKKGRRSHHTSLQASMACFNSRQYQVPLLVLAARTMAQYSVAPRASLDGFAPRLPLRLRVVLAHVTDCFVRDTHFLRQYSGLITFWQNFQLRPGVSSPDGCPNKSWNRRPRVSRGSQDSRTHPNTAQKVQGSTPAFWAISRLCSPTSRGTNLRDFPNSRRGANPLQRETRTQIKSRIQQLTQLYLTPVFSTTRLPRWLFLATLVEGFWPR